MILWVENTKQKFDWILQRIAIIPQSHARTTKPQRYHKKIMCVLEVEKPCCPPLWQLCYWFKYDNQSL